MIVISDTSPIINLARIGALDLLPALFGKVIIPKKVFDEITVEGADMPGANEIRRAKWVEVRECANKTFVQALQLQVDPGESEAIGLAIEMQARLLLIDERMGRQLAKEFQVPIMGLLGVLKMAKGKGLIPAVKPLIDRLIQTAGFRIGKELYLEILMTEGEI